MAEPKSNTHMRKPDKISKKNDGNNKEEDLTFTSGQPKIHSKPLRDGRAGLGEYAVGMWCNVIGAREEVKKHRVKVRVFLQQGTNSFHHLCKLNNSDGVVSGVVLLGYYHPVHCSLLFSL